jgi:Kef-type K+ transport system membrane component KefB
MLAGWLCSKAKLPPLLGMLMVGIVIGPLFVKVVVSKSSKFFVLITSRGSVHRFE